VTDNVARTVLEAFEILLGKTAAPARVASGSLLMLEGPPLAEQALEVLARESFCNELIESWTLIPDQELRKSERFHPDQVRLEFPRMHLRAVTAPETFDLMPLSEKQLQDLSASRFWALDISEMRTIRDYFIMESERGTRREQGLCLPTDVELEILAQTWSEHCKHKIFAAEVHYNDESPQASRKPIPARIEGLFAHTIAGVTAQIQRSWLLSVFKDNGGILAFDEEDAICIKAETHNSPSALDPYGGALTGIVGVNRDILGCGRGAKPIFNTDVFCLAAPDYA
jgi:phosphoribosylformylglycinamidine synthase